MRALKKFGERVSEIRKRSGVSQEALAEYADISRVSVSNIERGVQFCTFDTLCLFAERLQANLDDFFVDTPRVRKALREASIDAAVTRLRDFLEQNEKLSADDVAELLNIVGKIRRTKKVKTTPSSKTPRKRRAD